MGRITINPYEKGPKKSLNKDIKTQDKEIEITSNGTTEITPDAGFAYLNSVKVKTNVAQSGEGGGSGSSMRYIKVTSDDGIWANMLMYATLVAAEFKDGGSGIIPPAMTGTPVFAIKVGKGLAFCWDAKMVAQGQTITLGESMEAFFVQFDFQPEYITEEEFYTL